MEIEWSKGRGCAPSRSAELRAEEQTAGSEAEGEAEVLSGGDVGQGPRRDWFSSKAYDGVARRSRQSFRDVGSDFMRQP